MTLEQSKRSYGLNRSLFNYCSGLTGRDFEELFNKLQELKECIDNLEKFRAKLLVFPNLQVEEQVFSKAGIAINEVTQQPNSLGSMIRFIHGQFGLIDSQVEASEDILEKDKVLVTTLCSAKGLGAEFIFIMWLNNNFLPALNRDVKEELRVLCVGMTRAKENIIFTFYERYDKKRHKRVKAISPFLQKIINHINVIRLMKSDFKKILSIFYGS